MDNERVLVNSQDKNLISAGGLWIDSLILLLRFLDSILFLHCFVFFWFYRCQRVAALQLWMLNRGTVGCCHQQSNQTTAGVWLWIRCLTVSQPQTAGDQTLTFRIGRRCGNGVSILWIPAPYIIAAVAVIKVQWLSGELIRPSPKTPPTKPNLNLLHPDFLDPDPCKKVPSFQQVLWKLVQ